MMFSLLWEQIGRKELINLDRDERKARSPDTITKFYVSNFKKAFLKNFYHIEW